VWERVLVLEGGKRGEGSLGPEIRGVGGTSQEWGNPVSKGHWVTGYFLHRPSEKRGGPRLGWGLKKHFKGG